MTSFPKLLVGSITSGLFHQADIFPRQLIRQMVQKLAYGGVGGRVPTLAWEISFPCRFGRFRSHWAPLMIDTDYHTIQKKSPIQGQVFGDVGHADLDPGMFAPLGTTEFRRKSGRLGGYPLADFI